MYIVFIDYHCIADKFDDAMLIWFAGPADIKPWAERAGFKTKTFCIRRGELKERYILGDFKDAYSACMFSKRIDKLANNFGYDQIIRIATEFECDLRRRAMRSVRRKKLLATTVETALGEGAGRG